MLCQIGVPRKQPHCPEKDFLPPPGFSLQDPVRRSHAQRTVTAKAWQQAALVTKDPWLQGDGCHTHKEVGHFVGSLTKIRIIRLFMEQILIRYVFGTRSCVI